MNSLRDAVLHLISKINADISIQFIVNGSYDAPFFGTWFRDALYHFSAIYDMHDSQIHENERKMMIEREL